MLKHMERLNRDPKTKDLKNTEKIIIIGCTSSTWGHFNNLCNICMEHFPVIRNKITRCSNCRNKACIPCLARMFSGSLSESSHYTFLAEHCVKCPLYRSETGFRVASGEHGLQSHDIPTNVFTAASLKIINTTIIELEVILVKSSIKLCTFHGKLMSLMRKD